MSSKRNKKILEFEKNVAKELGTMTTVDEGLTVKEIKRFVKAFERPLPLGHEYKPFSKLKDIYGCEEKNSLLPCPCCGGNADFTKKEWRAWGGVTTIKCKTKWCGLSLSQKDRSLAIASWNLRAKEEG